MAQPAAFLLTVASAFMVVPLTAPSAAERNLGRYEELQAVAPEGFNCEEPTVEVRAPAGSAFQGDRLKLQKLVGGLRIMLAYECPDLERLTIVGEAGGREVFRGEVRKADGWALTDAAQPLGAVNSERLREAGTGGAVAEGGVPQPAEPPAAKEGLPDAGRAPGRSTGGTLLAQSSPKERCRILFEWADRLATEYPGVDFRQLDRVLAPAANLYRADSFVPLFGQPYEKMAEETRRDLFEKVVRRCIAAPEHQDIRRTTNFVLIRPLTQERGPLSFRTLVPAIGKAGQDQAWMEQALADMASLPVEPDSLGRLETLEEEGERRLGDLWPSERKRFADAVRDLRHEMTATLARSQIAGLPETIRGLEESVRIVEDARSVLDDRSWQALDRETGAKRSAITAAAVEEARGELAELGGGWRNAPEVLDRGRSLAALFEKAGAVEGAESVRQAVAGRVDVMLRESLPLFERQLAAVGEDWDGLTELQRIDADLAGLRQAAGLDLTSYEGAVGERRERILDRLAETAAAGLETFGSGYEDIGAIAERGDTEAERLEQAGSAAGAERVREAAAMRITELVEAGLPAFGRDLAALDVSRETAAGLDEEIAGFVELAEMIPAFGRYAAVARERQAEILSRVCDAAIERAGGLDGDREAPILGPEDAMPLADFVCGLDAAGHQVSAFSRTDEAEAEMRILEADGDFAHARLHVVEALPGRRMLVGSALGDANRQDPITVAAWREYVTGLLSVSAVPVEGAVEACDLLAADPEDPARTAQGVPAQAVDLQAAYDACTVALEQEPDNPRLAFQLGRVLLLADYPEEAAGRLVAAADAGHAAAVGHVAGLIAGGEAGYEADPATAAGLHQMAAVAGYGPSMAAYQALTGAPVDMAAARAGAPTAEDFDRFNQPKIIKALYDGDFGVLNEFQSGLVAEQNGVPLSLVTYFTAFADQANTPYEGIGCPGLLKAGIGARLSQRAATAAMNPEAVMGSLEQMFMMMAGSMGARGGDPFTDGMRAAQDMMQPMIEGETRIGVLKEAGQKDALILAQKYGCDHPLSRKVMSNLNAYVLN
jgi:hypothetical protein